MSALVDDVVTEAHKTLRHVESSLWDAVTSGETTPAESFLLQEVAVRINALLPLLSAAERNIREKKP